MTAAEPEYDFVAADGFGHTFWVVDDDATISAITEAFDKIPELYIADGHHRTAAAALVGNEKARLNPQHRGDEEYNYFLAVAFPASHLKIIDYNRVVKDLNGLSPEEFLERLGYSFEVHDMGTEPYTPARLHNFSLYLEDRWYSLTARPGTYDDKQEVSSTSECLTHKAPLSESPEAALALSAYLCQSSLWITRPERSFGSNHVVLGGIMLPVSAMRMSCSIDTGNRASATAISPLSTRRFSSPRPRIPPTKSMRLSLRRSDSESGALCVRHSEVLLTSCCGCRSGS